MNAQQKLQLRRYAYQNNRDLHRKNRRLREQNEKLFKWWSEELHNNCMNGIHK